jgi:FSR family fosmidomycin resistance protein-like MFS transporter
MVATIGARPMESDATMSPGESRPDALEQAVHQSASSQAPARQRVALTTTSSAHFLHDGIADSLYVLLPLWSQAFGLNYTQVGSLKTAYSAAMAVFQMPAGVLAERCGERALLVGGTLLAGAAFAGMSVASGYPSLFLLILVVGLGSAVQHPLASAIISQAYPAERRRSALGIYNFSGDLGKMVVAFGVAAAAGAIGWQATVIGYGAVVAAAGVVLSLVLLRYGLGKFRAAATIKGGQPAFDVGMKGGLRLTNARGFTLLSCIHAVDSASRTGDLTLLPFVLLQKGASPSTIGLALAGIFAGGAVGKLACGLLADRVGILRTVIVTEIATAAVILATLASPLATVLWLMPLLGVALNGTSSVLYGTVTDFVSADRQARAFGLFYTIGSAAGGASPLLFGALSDWIGLGHAIVGLSVIVIATVPLAVALRPHLVAHR